MQRQVYLYSRTCGYIANDILVWEQVGLPLRMLGRHPHPGQRVCCVGHAKDPTACRTGTPAPCPAALLHPGALLRGSSAP